MLVGMSKVMTPPVPMPPSTPCASVPRFCDRKPRPLLVTRTDPAFSIRLVVSNPPAIGVIPPQLEQPLLHPPPLQPAMRITATIAKRCRIRTAGEADRGRDGRREDMAKDLRAGSTAHNAVPLCAMVRACADLPQAPKLRRFVVHGRGSGCPPETPTVKASLARAPRRTALPCGVRWPHATLRAMLARVLDEPAMTAALDHAFAYEIEDIIERGLLAYEPILSLPVMAQLREHLRHVLHRDSTMKPWLAQLPGQEPIDGIGTLTAGQVALLGGTRPLRVLHALAPDFGLRAESKSRAHLGFLLLSSTEALNSLVEHHVVAPARGREACARRLREFVNLAVAAMIAALMGTLYDHRMSPGVPGREEETPLVKRHFSRMGEAFTRITLTRKDQGIFRDYYLDEAHIEELAEEGGRGLAAEVERRRGFLKRLAAALKEQCAILAGAAGRHEAAVVAPEALPGATSDAAIPAVSRAVARATLPRKR